MNKYYLIFEVAGNNLEQIEQLAKEIEGNTSMECSVIIGEEDYLLIEGLRQRDIRKGGE